jgi:hypothetical protein
MQLNLYTEVAILQAESFLPTMLQGLSAIWIYRQALLSIDGVDGNQYVPDSSSHPYPHLRSLNFTFTRRVTRTRI